MGGAGGSTLGTSGNQGSNTIFGSYTAIGGGGGASSTTTAGGTGGSGGGGSTGGAGGAGTAGQGNAGGGSSATSTTAGGAGGGAGGAGQDNSAGSIAYSTGTTGGAGLSYNITGASVLYANGGPGGIPGGGTSGANGAVNTGSGGGGGGNPTAGNGGSGIVVISYPGAQLFTGGTISTVGTNTVHTFTSNGTLVSAANSTVLFLSSAQSKFGNTSLSTNNGTGFASTKTVTYGDPLDFSSGNIDWTIETWAYPTANPNTASSNDVSGAVISWGGGANNGYAAVSLGLSNTGNWVAQWNANNSLLGDANVTYTASLNTWTHLALTKQANTVRMFVNGTLANTRSAANSGIWIPSSPWTFGAMQNGTNRFIGYIDETRLTKGVARYTSSFTAQTAPFADYYAASAVSSAYVSDSAPTGPSPGSLWWNSNTGTMYVYYNDPNSSQWVEIAPSPGGGTSTSTSSTSTASLYTYSIILGRG